MYHRASVAAATSAAVFGASYLTRSEVHFESAPPKVPTKLLTGAELTRALSRLESSHLWSGVKIYCGQYPSNPICEDDHIEERAKIKGRDWLFFGIFDGHSGWNASAHLRAHLVPYVVKELNSEAHDSAEAAMSAGFEKLDYDMVHAETPPLLKKYDPTAAARILPTAFAGSCALLGAFDPSTRLLRLALAGDSRAVLGVQQKDGEWTAEALTVDQTGENPDEIARIRKEHPGEKYAVHNGRVLGYQPSRAFGDARTKWPRAVQDRLQSWYWGRRYNPYLLTPPYITASPVVTTTRIDNKRMSFLVLGSDGLFELLTNDQIVQAVAEWTTHNPVNVKSLTANLPGDGFRRDQEKPKFTTVDANAGTNLIRNALGGADTNKLSVLASIPLSQSRNFRDDLTVTVVFFPPASKL